MRANASSLFINDFNGGRSRARTYDPLIKSQLLYQLSYAPIEIAGAWLPREARHVAKASGAVQPAEQSRRSSGGDILRRPAARIGAGDELIARLRNNDVAQRLQRRGLRATNLVEFLDLICRFVLGCVFDLAA